MSKLIKKEIKVDKESCEDKRSINCAAVRKSRLKRKLKLMERKANIERLKQELVSLEHLESECNNLSLNFKILWTTLEQVNFSTIQNIDEKNRNRIADIFKQLKSRFI
jgi:hypothetical protein